jgi:ABC-type uncharacterized transport system substrate-binding protein
LERTAVIVSSAIPEYMQIVEKILERGAEAITVHELSGQEANATRVLAEIESANPDRLVAIGLLAAVVARRVSDTPMVFCQVYNYQDQDLLSATSKGVHLLPPFDLQLEAWRELAPSLRRIGIVIGPGQEQLVDEIRQDVAGHGVELTVRTVQSDQEALRAFKTIAPRIDGLWLLPDNRILSPDVVRAILAHGAKHHKQIAVFGDNLLDMGALLSSASDPDDVVERVFLRFDHRDEEGRFLGPDLVRLTDVQVHVNAAVATHLGLIVPEHVAVASWSPE